MSNQRRARCALHKLMRHSSGLDSTKQTLPNVMIGDPFDLQKFLRIDLIIQHSTIFVAPHCQPHAVAV